MSALDQDAAASVSATTAPDETGTGDLRDRLHADLVRRIEEIESPEYRASEVYATGPAVWREVVIVSGCCLAVWVATVLVHLL